MKRTRGVMAGLPNVFRILPSNTISQYKLSSVLIAVTAFTLSGVENAMPRVPLPVVIDLSTEEPDLVIVGAADLDKSGWKVASGDVNGDGWPDVVILASGSSPLGRQGAGTVAIVWGGQGLPVTIELSEASGFSVIAGIADWSPHPGSLACADVNGDGCDDVILGIPWKDPYNHCAVDGTAFIAYGQPAFPDTLDLEGPSSPTTRVIGHPCGDGHLGLFTAAAGDVNADGYADVALAATNLAPDGEVYIIYGVEAMPSTVHLSGDPASEGFVRILGYHISEGIGRALAMGDVDDDSFDDLLIGSPGDYFGYLNGKARLIYGASALPDTIDLKSYTGRMVTFNPEPDVLGEYHLGESLAIGDVDGDGFGDVVLGARGDRHGAGQVYVVHGSNGLPEALGMDSQGYPITHLVGTGDQAGYGENLCCGDLTGDHRDEIVILKDSAYDPRTSRNQVIVYYGTSLVRDSVFLATDTLLSRIVSGADGAESKFGYDLAVGDFDQVGEADLMIGAYRANPLGRRSAGKVIGIDSRRLTQPAEKSPPAPELALIPNPFSGETNVSYTLVEPTRVILDVFDVTGRRVAQLVNDYLPAGVQTLAWNGRLNDGTVLPSGVYFLRLRTEHKSIARKAVIIR